MSKYTAEDIYKNSIDFINIGMKEFLEGNDQYIKTSVRNLYCGIELLLKAYILEKTEEYYGDTFIHKRINHVITPNKNGNILSLVPKDHLTINVVEAINLIKCLGIFPSADVNIINDLQEKIERIRRKRNTIEHAHIDHPEKFLIHVVVNSYYVILKLTRLLGNKLTYNIEKNILNKMKERIKTYKMKREKYINRFCKEDRSAANYLECIYCESMEIYPINEDAQVSNSDIKCENCNKIFNFDIIIDSIVNSSTFAETHQNIRSLNNLPYDKFTVLNEEQLKQLSKATMANSQILWIKDDPDVLKFISKIDRARKKE